MTPLLPYIDEVVECPVCCGWGNFMSQHTGHSTTYGPTTLVDPCTYCKGTRTIFQSEYRMREFQQLAQHG